MSQDPELPIKVNVLPPNSGRWHGLFSSLRFIIAVGILVVMINTFGLQSYQVYGQSMFPTLEDGDRLIISKFGRTYSRLLGRDYIPKRGEIIVFDDPFASDRQLIKRVVALPGERVTLEDGVLMVYNDHRPNGFKPDETGDYSQGLVFTVGSVDVTVPDRQVFVIGDNRGSSGSLDSRNELGTVPVEKINGDLLLRLYPLSGLRLF